MTWEYQIVYSVFYLSGNVLFECGRLGICISGNLNPNISLVLNKTLRNLVMKAGIVSG
jgi:hypothetical protein